MKTKFELDLISSPNNVNSGMAKIIGTYPKHRPYVSFEVVSRIVGGDKRVSGCIKDGELERFAVNILKALKSKRLKP